MAVVKRFLRFLVSISENCCFFVGIIFDLVSISGNWCFFVGIIFDLKNNVQFAKFVVLSRIYGQLYCSVDRDALGRNWKKMVEVS